MSRALSLVRFRDRSVYQACYDGTSGYLYPWLITPRKVRTQFNDSLFSFDDYNHDHYDERYKDPDLIHDSEPVKIYIDYGYGFMWNGLASKSELYITSPLSYENNDNNHTIDLWVYEYFINHKYDTSYIENKIIDPLFKKSIFRVGDYAYLVATVDEINYRPGYFKPSPPTEPIPKKIIRVDYTKDGIQYQMKGGYHFNERKIGLLAFKTYEEAEEGMKRRFSEGYKWKGLDPVW